MVECEASPGRFWNEEGETLRGRGRGINVHGVVRRPKTAPHGPEPLAETWRSVRAPAAREQGRVKAASLHPLAGRPQATGLACLAPRGVPPPPASVVFTDRPGSRVYTRGEHNGLRCGQKTCPPRSSTLPCPGRTDVRLNTHWTGLRGQRRCSEANVRPKGPHGRRSPPSFRGFAGPLRTHRGPVRARACVTTGRSTAVCAGRQAMARAVALGRSPTLCGVESIARRFWNEDWASLE